ncbi:DUF4192 domain-containing protein [Nocardia panacis]|uniref:DUF4192 domain-containing protein n=1 Tax=Nocardia panacis TaxID=2340916 RepID=A0A3A4K0P0_9NOCA|nr:DUF4192 domain-containing protein [Nocardia panacis]RJO69466.1 DUF4192 domain-containing protein [Nocardia panacis]
MTTPASAELRSAGPSAGPSASPALRAAPSESRPQTRGFGPRGVGLGGVGLGGFGLRDAGCSAREAPPPYRARIARHAAGARSACAEGAPRFGARIPPGAVHIHNPGDLIAAMPALVGFPPERSLIIAVLCQTAESGSAGAASPVDGPGPVEEPELIDAVARFDLDQPQGSLRADMVAPYVVQVCAGVGAARVLAILVDDRGVVPLDERRSRSGRGPFGALARSLRRELAADEIEVADAWAVSACEPGQVWWSLLGPRRHGILPDPTASAVAMSQVLDGRPIRRSRSELTDLVATDSRRQAEVAARLAEVGAAAGARFEQAVRRGDPNSYSRCALQYVLRQIEGMAVGSEPDPSELAELVAALRDPTVRDAMFALPAGEYAEAAERLWITLTQTTDGPDRAEAAALLGYHAYTRGDGPLAGVALQAARAAAPGHPMAQLLETSLYMGLRPAHLKRLVRCGYEAALDLGINLRRTRS